VEKILANGNVTGQIAPTIKSSSYVDFVADLMNCKSLTTSINTIIEDDLMKIYPNPANNYLVLELNKVINQIEIFSITGQEIFINDDSMKGNKVIDLSEFESGIYMVRAKAGNREYTKRIIKN